jgi:ribosome recycling factor
MDQEEINMYLEDAKQTMDHSIDHLHKELGKISTGKANPAMVKDLLVSYYGIFMPPLTEERRKLLAKQAKALGEEAKVSIRNIRRDIMDTIKKAVKDGYSEDDGKRMESNIQEMTDGHTAKIDQICETKEKDIMTI